MKSIFTPGTILVLQAKPTEKTLIIELVGTYDSGVEFIQLAELSTYGKVTLLPKNQVFAPWQQVTIIVYDEESIQLYHNAVGKRDESGKSGEQTLDTQVKNV